MSLSEDLKGVFQKEFAVVIKAYSPMEDAEVPLSTIFKDKFIIVDVYNPLKGEIDFLQDIGINLDDIQDSLDEDEIARISKTETYTHIILKIITEEEYFKKTTVGIFLLDNIIIVVRKRKISPITNAIRECLKKRVSNKRIAIYLVLREITKYFLNLTKRINHEAERLRDIVYKRRRSYTSLLVWNLKEDTNTLVNVLDQNIEVIKLISQGEIFPLGRKEKMMFQDLYQDFLQIISMLRMVLQTLESIFQAFHTLVSYDINRRIELLTIITIVLSIPTIITSLYGMNFKYIPLAKHPLGFVIVTMFSILLAIASYYIFRRFSR